VERVPRDDGARTMRTPYAAMLVGVAVVGTALAVALIMRPVLPAGWLVGLRSRIPGDEQLSTLPTATPEAYAFVDAAVAQVGVTTSYDSSYAEIPYPGGDVPLSTGVCTDVVVRAFRGVGVDLQQAVHEDMTADFGAYPDRWGLDAPDPNIDHRRVRNLQTYFARQGWEAPVSDSGPEYVPGDIVTWSVYGRAHIGIVSAEPVAGGTRYTIVHNIGRGARVEDVLFAFPITGHYRVSWDALGTAIDGEASMDPDHGRGVTLTIVYDNNGPVADAEPTDPPLRTGWGFACLVETDETALLFDTGGDGGALVNNLDALGIDAAAIDILVLSHEHWDHTDGLEALLETGAQPTAYVPQSFSAGFRDGLAARVPVVEVTGPAEIAPGIRTTGEMGSAIIEQSLVIETSEGLVVITGCAHPGIVGIVSAAAEGGDIGLVIGGFHLKDDSATEIDEVIADLQALGVKRVAPTHCTGDEARERFRAVFGDGFVPVGVGSVVRIRT
jgi:uncharacterized protein YijF (DUF1287 family)/metal-dependent hydrolase (beta-lactamase superfamily II)